MDAIATHHSAPAAPGPKRSEPASKPTPSPAVVAVWEAEDGRCEACGRPMDRTCARTGRDKRGDRRLVCPDCKEQRPDPLTAAIVAQKTTEHGAAVRGHDAGSGGDLAGRRGARVRRPGPARGQPSAVLAAGRRRLLPAPEPRARPPAGDRRPARHDQAAPGDPYPAPGAHARAAAAARAEHDGGSKPAMTTGSSSASLARPARRILVSDA
jgi:hypothetical protein